MPDIFVILIIYSTTNLIALNTIFVIGVLNVKKVFKCAPYGYNMDCEDLVFANVVYVFA